MMKKFFLSMFLTLGLFCQASFAASVQNRDKTEHILLITTPQEMFKVVIEPMGYIHDICPVACRVEVVGYSLIDLEKGDLAQVTEGRLEIKK